MRRAARSATGAHADAPLERVDARVPGGTRTGDDHGGRAGWSGPLVSTAEPDPRSTNGDDGLPPRVAGRPEPARGADPGGGRATTAVDWVVRWSGEEGRHWSEEAARYDEINRVFGEALVEAARLAPGERVLDVGCGAGATATQAARRVRPGGSVLGVDLSPDLLAVARARAARVGATELELVEADAATYPYGEEVFDVVVSRNGLMFFGDADAGFAHLARALRPGGRLAFTAPQGLDRNPWIMVAGAAAAAHVGAPSVPAPGQPGPLGLADPARIEAVLGRAGFTELTVEELTASIRIGADVEDASAFIRSIPVVRDLLAAAPAARRSAAIEAVGQALARHAAPDGVVLEGNGAWLVTARR